MDFLIQNPKGNSDMYFCGPICVVLFLHSVIFFFMI